MTLSWNPKQHKWGKKILRANRAKSICDCDGAMGMQRIDNREIIMSRINSKSYNKECYG